MNRATAPQNYDVFISYNRRDSTSAMSLASRLSEEGGLRVWIDRQLNPGEDWRGEIESALQASIACVVVWGPHGLGRVQSQERSLAYVVRDSRPAFRVVYLLLPGVAPPEATWANVDTWVQFQAGLDETDPFERLVAALRGAAPPGILSELPDVPTPYCGLAPFSERDARFFAGREREVQEIVSRLVHYPFLALLGASGSGKTSLVQAGVLAQLKAGAVHGKKDWTSLVVRPGADPLRSLAFELSRIEPDQDRLAVADDRERRLRLDPESILEIVETSLHGNSCLILVIDRLEEIFTLASDARDAVQLFVSAVVALTARARGSTLIIATLRADFYGRIGEYPELVSLISQHQHFVGNLTSDSVREIIEEPAKCVGALFETGLADQVYQEARSREKLKLPLLQLTLELLWTKRRGRWLTWDAYKEIGKLAGALQYHANGVMNALSPEDVVVARRILTRLVWVADDGALSASKRDQKDALIERSTDDGMRCQRLLEHLSDRRLIVVSDAQPAMVELIHDSLTVGWEWLRQAVEEDMLFLRWRQDLDLQAARWVRSERDKSALLRGNLLEEARNWLVHRAVDLSRAERAFVTASIDAEATNAEKERFLLWRAQLQVHLRRWENDKDDEQNLLQVEALAEARRWRKWASSHSESIGAMKLDDKEASFILASHNARVSARKSRIRRKMMLRLAWHRFVRGLAIGGPIVIAAAVAWFVWIRSDLYQVQEIVRESKAALLESGDSNLAWLDILVASGQLRDAVSIAEHWGGNWQVLALQRVADTLGNDTRAEEYSRRALETALALEQKNDVERVQNLSLLVQLAQGFVKAAKPDWAAKAFRAAQDEWRKRGSVDDLGRSLSSYDLEKWAALGVQAKVGTEATRLWLLATDQVLGLAPDSRPEGELATLFQSIPPDVSPSQILALIKRLPKGSSSRSYQLNLPVKDAIERLIEDNRPSDAMQLAELINIEWLAGDTDTTEYIFRLLAESLCCTTRIEALAEAMPGDHRYPPDGHLLVRDMWKTYARTEVVRGLAKSGAVDEAISYFSRTANEYEGHPKASDEYFACSDFAIARALAKANRLEEALARLKDYAREDRSACVNDNIENVLVDIAVLAAKYQPPDVVLQIVPTQIQPRIFFALAEAKRARGEKDEAHRLVSEFEKSLGHVDSHLSEIGEVARFHVDGGRLRHARLLVGDDLELHSSGMEHLRKEIKLLRINVYQMIVAKYYAP